MKFDISRVISSIILSAGLIISASILANNFYMIPSSSFPSSLTVETKEDEPKEFMALHELTTYLSMNREDILNLIDNDELLGTYTVVKDESGENRYYFSTAKIDEWLSNKIN